MPTVNQGLDEALDTLDRLEDPTSHPLYERVLDEACVEDMRRQSAKIPRDTGASAKALLRANDRAHVGKLGADKKFRYGAALKQLFIHMARYPRPSADRVAAAVAEIWARQARGQ